MACFSYSSQMFFILLGMLLSIALYGQDTLQANYTLADTTQARVLMEEAITLVEERNLDDALEKVQKARKIFTFVLGIKAMEVADCWDQIGEIYYLHNSQVYYESAKTFFDSALVIRLATLGKAHHKVATSYNNLGSFYYIQGKYEQALQNYEKAFHIRLAVLDETHPDLAESYYNLGLIFRDQGSYEKAVQYYEKALEIKLASQGEFQPGIAKLYNNMGIIYYYQGKYYQAIQYYKKALDISLAISGEVHLNIADSYNNLGIIYFFQGKYEQAIQYYEKALDIRVAALGNVHPYIATSYMNLGIVYDELGDYIKVIQNYNKALDIYLKTLGDVHQDVARFYINLSYFYYNQENYWQAVQYNKKALEALNFSNVNALNKVNSISHLFTILKMMGGLYQKQYLSTKNISELYKSKDWLLHAETVLNYQNQSIIENDKTELAMKAFLAYDVVISTYYLLSEATDSTHYLNKSFTFSERTKSHLLYQAIKEADALTFAGIPDSLLEMEDDLRIDIAFYEKQHRDSLIAGLSETDSTVLTINSLLFDLKREYETLKAHFEKNYPDYYRLKYDLSTVSVKEVQQELLNPNQTLLEYFVGDSSIYLFVIQKNDYQVLEIKKDFPLDSLVHQLREGLYGYHQAPKQTVSLQQESINKYNAAAQELYQRLIAPAKNLLNVSLIIIPDGVLNYIPFEVLLETEAKDPYDFSSYPYLLKSHQISYCYSATLLREMQQKRHKEEPEKSLLAFAPFYEGSYEYLQDMFGHVHQSTEMDTLDWIINRSDFAELPNSGEEVITISQLWNGDYYIDQDATEERFNQIAGDYRILHLSTHGIADSRVGDYSYLAFSEVKDSIENELLYVRDLYNLQLNADLVVLSACETGIGELQRGEGMVSLARAFSYAGAKSIVSSLWVVKDVATKHLMQRFHRQLKLGSGKDRALQEAKLQYIKDFPGEMSHPYFWAGFVGIGDMGALTK